MPDSAHEALLAQRVADAFTSPNLSLTCLTSRRMQQCLHTSLLLKSGDVEGRNQPMNQGTEAAEDIVPSELSGLLGFQLRMAQVSLYRDYAANMSALNLTQPQMAVLSIVAASPGVSQVDIAFRLSTDRGTMLAIVDRLEDRELISRRRSKEDRRRQELHLTSAGIRTLEKARAIVAKHEKRFTDRFTPRELAQLLAALRRLQA